jgi:hypothetical protein
MAARKFMLMAFVGMLVLGAGTVQAQPKMQLDPYTTQDVFCRFPFVQVVPLDSLGAWGLLYADTYGKLHLLKATPKGWKLEWEVTNLGAKIRKFFLRDLTADGVMEVVIATVDGRILVYSIDSYQNIWQNLENNFASISAIEVANVDNDPQLEFVFIADSHLYIVDGATKSRQWVSQREVEASEIVIANVDKDEQPEIILNSGFIVDSRFLTIEVESVKPFGDRIILFDMNNDGYPEIIGEFADYSLRVFDVYARREVW